MTVTGAESVSQSAPRRSWIRRHLIVVLVAVIVLPVAGIGLWWDVATLNAKKAADGQRWPDECANEASNNLRFVAALVPRTSELSEVTGALQRVLDKEQWRLVLLQQSGENGGGQSSFKTVVDKDGDGYLIDRGDGFKAFVSPDSALVHQPGSSVWVPGCPNTPFYNQGDRASCVVRTRRGNDIDYAWSTLNGVACGRPAGTAPGTMEWHAVLRDRKLVSIRSELATPGTTAVDVYSFGPPGSVSEPWFFQQVPSWFARWASS